MYREPPRLTKFCIVALPGHTEAATDRRFSANLLDGPRVFGVSRRMQPAGDRRALLRDDARTITR
jgi:hypothetical protein